MGPWGISITPVEAPEAAFTAEPTSGKAPLEVSFTDKSTGTEPLTYAWDFDNDGMVDSTEQNPTYTYENAGTYTVRLTVSNAAGNDEEIKTDYITVTESQMVDILFDGTVVLTPGETFSVTAYNSGQAYTFNKIRRLVHFMLQRLPAVSHMTLLTRTTALQELYSWTMLEATIM
ncbi:MAG: PKD domain-containing protein [Tepidanaerobacteraceae bacterium]